MPTPLVLGWGSELAHDGKDLLVPPTLVCESAMELALQCRHEPGRVLERHLRPRAIIIEYVHDGEETFYLIRE